MSRETDLQMQAFQRAIERLALLHSPDYAQAGGNVGMRSACVRGDIAAVDQFVKQGTSINMELNTDGDTPLTKSIFSRQSDLAVWLIAHGADFEKALRNGRTPLITAAGCGDMRVVDALLAAGASINRQMNNGATALMYAVSKGFVDVARKLIQKGASTTLRDNDGWTVLDYARMSGVNPTDLNLTDL